MDRKNEGITWMYKKRETFAGLDIDWKNHRSFKESFKQDYIEENVDRVERGEITDEELERDAEKYAKEHIKYNKKMKRAHDKGHSHFMFNGRREPVRTLEMLQRFHEGIERIQEQYKINKNKEEEE